MNRKGNSRKALEKWTAKIGMQEVSLFHPEQAKQNEEKAQLCSRGPIVEGLVSALDIYYSF